MSSAFAAPAAAGIPVTHRNVSTSVTVVTGHAGDPSLPGVDWDTLGRLDGTLVVLMGVGARAAVAERLIAAGRSPGTPVAVVRWGTTDRQEVVRTTLDHLADVDLGAPAAIVVGAVAGLDVTAAVGAAGGALTRCTARTGDRGRRRSRPRRPLLPVRYRNRARSPAPGSWSPGPGPRRPDSCTGWPTWVPPSSSCR